MSRAGQTARAVLEGGEARSGKWSAYLPQTVTAALEALRDREPATGYSNVGQIMNALGKVRTFGKADLPQGMYERFREYGIILYFPDVLPDVFIIDLDAGEMLLRQLRRREAVDQPSDEDLRDRHALMAEERGLALLEPIELIDVSKSPDDVPEIHACLDSELARLVEQLQERRGHAPSQEWLLAVQQVIASRQQVVAQSGQHRERRRELERQLRDAQERAWGADYRRGEWQRIGLHEGAERYAAEARTWSATVADLKRQLAEL